MTDRGTRIRHLLPILGFVLLRCGFSNGADWPQWRGPDRNGVVVGGPKLSVDWGDEGPRKVWESETMLSGTKGGCGSPVVTGGRVYLFVHIRRDKKDKDSVGHDQVFCLDAADGKTVWKYEVEDTERGFPGSSTVAVSGGRVYFADSNRQLCCLDAADGKVVWETAFYEKCGRFGNTNSSPVVADGVVVLLSDVLTGINAEDGSILWKLAESKGRSAYESSPAVWRNGKDAYAICSAHDKVVCAELKTGALKWTIPGYKKCTPSVVVVGDTLVVQGYKGTGLSAYRLSPDKPAQLWSQPELIAQAGSPAADARRVYAMTQGLASCLDMADGKVVWQQPYEKIETYAASKNRMPDGWTSPVVADGKVFVVFKGTMYVLAADGDGFGVLATLDPTRGKRGMGMVGYAVPAIVDGRMYMRQSKAIVCYDLAIATQ